MGPIFALVLTIGMTNGDFQDVVLGIYDNEQQCKQAAVEQSVNGECLEVEGIIRNGELPAKM